eukprot:NODE_415_length_7892_cov_0.421917.p2 type:complete len:603 gc:universal NODE_415_length_7892_cov_0.421917:2314-506(-)
MLLIPVVTSLTDCENLKQFATGLGMPTKNPSLMNQINTSCCSAAIFGVICIGGVIKSISWPAMGLNGVFNANLPSQLETLDIGSNAITGNLPTTGYPSTLKRIQLDTNLMTGVIPQLPDGLDFASFEDNRFSSYGTLPANLTYFSTSFTPISRSFPSDLPRKLVTFKAEENQLFGPISNLPDTLSILIFKQNYDINGVLPKLPPGLTELNAMLNHLTGITYPLPDSIIKFEVYDNLIPGPVVIPPFVQVFSVASNLFSGEVPQFPPSLTRVDLDTCNLSGDISNITFFHVQPNSNSKLTEAYFYYNQFTGAMPKLPASLQILHLYGNQMNGPVAPMPAAMVDLQISSQLFSGTMNLKQPQYLLIDGTLIHDLVVQDPIRLSSSTCSFSNTPMQNNPNAAALNSKCKHTGLYAYVAPVVTNTKPVIITGTTTSPDFISGTSPSTSSNPFLAQSSISATAATIFETVQTSSHDLISSSLVSDTTSVSQITSSITQLLVTSSQKLAIDAIATRIVRHSSISLQSIYPVSIVTSTLTDTPPSIATQTDNPNDPKFTKFQLNPFAFNLGVFEYIRSLISMFMIASVLTKTPWKRSRKVDSNSNSITV